MTSFLSQSGYALANGNVFDLLVNLCLSKAERPLEPKASMLIKERTQLAGLMWQSFNDREAFSVPDRVFRDDILLSFELLVQNEDAEVAVIAISSELDERSFRDFAANRGTRNNVSLPANLDPILQKRASDGIYTQVLLIHNHPHNSQATRIHQACGTPPGPSGLDRKTLLHWVHLYLNTNMLIEPVFLLLEEGKWRHFCLPGFDFLKRLYGGISSGDLSSQFNLDEWLYHIPRSDPINDPLGLKMTAQLWDVWWEDLDLFKRSTNKISDSTSPAEEWFNLATFSLHYLRKMSEKNRGE